MSQPARLEDLLGQAAWLRRFAIELVGAEAADDVAQETLLRALRWGQGTRAWRPWLAHVARTVAMRWRRGDARRLRREARAARDESLPSTADTVAAFAAQRAVADAVLALEEPYRSTLLLRFWEDLPPREVARRMEVPVETVRTRIKRGCALVRARLDGAGGRAAWLVPLLGVSGVRDAGATAVAGSGLFASVAALGGLVMAKAASIALVGVVLLAAAGWWLWPRAPHAAHGAGGTQSPAPPSVAADPATSRAERPAGGAAESQALVPERTVAPPVGISGWVEDQRGARVAGLRVQVRDRWPEPALVRQQLSGLDDALVRQVLGTDVFGEATTGENGEFTIARSERAPEVVQLGTIGTDADGLQAVWPSTLAESLRWPSAGVKLTVHRGGTVRVRAVAQESGAALDEFAVYLWQAGSPRGVPLGRARADSRACDCFPSFHGPAWLLVVPDDEALLATDRMRIDVPEQGCRDVAAVIAPGLAVQATVIDDGGKPLAGACLESWEMSSVEAESVTLDPFLIPDYRRPLREPGRGTITEFDLLATVARYGSAESDHAVYPRVLSRATSDAHGRARLVFDPRTRRCAVLVSGEGIVRKLFTWGHVPEAAIELVASRGGTIRAVLEPPGFPLQAPLLLEQASDANETRAVETTAGGEVVARGLEPGSWVMTYAGKRLVPKGAQQPELVVRTGEECRCTFDLGGLRPGCVRARVEVAGVDAARLRGASLWLRDADHPRALRVKALDGDETVFESVMPGSYALSLQLVGSNPGVVPTLAGLVCVEPDREQVITAKFEVRELVLVCVDRQTEQPIPGARVEVHGPSDYFAGGYTDAAGRLPIAPAPLGTVRVVYFGIVAPNDIVGLKRAWERGGVAVDLTVGTGDREATVRVRR